jgi:tetratricopeptide (TPR) repeat protein
MAIQRDQRRCYHRPVHSPAELSRLWARLSPRVARTAVVITLIAGLAPAVARAQTPPEDEPPAATEDKARARVYFERAETLKHSGSARAEAGDMAGARAAYTEAASVYLRAFELFPHAAFLYNAAQMQRLSGQSAKALASYQRYLAVDPEGDKAGEARAHIAELRRERTPSARTATSRRDASQAEDAETEDSEDEDGEDEGGEDEGGEDEDAEDADGEDAGDAGDGDADGEGADGDGDAAASADGDEALPGAAGALDGEARPDTGRSLRTGGLITLAAGAVALGVGVKFGLDAQGIADELSGFREMWNVEDRERFAEGERAERTAVVLMGIGGAAVLTGTVLYLVGLNRGGSKAGDSGLGVSASATSDGASMLLWGRF